MSRHARPALVTRAEAAALLRQIFRARCQAQRLANLANEGRGPPYYSWGGGGRALYPRRQLLAWAKGQLRPPPEKITWKDRAKKRRTAGPIAPPE